MLVKGTLIAKPFSPYLLGMSLSAADPLRGRKGTQFKESVDGHSPSHLEPSLAPLTTHQCKWTARALRIKGTKERNQRENLLPSLEL